MTEKIPVTKKRGFRICLKIISLPILVSVFVVANSDSVLSTLDKKYDSFLSWQSPFLSIFKNTEISQRVSLDNVGVIFDEILEPRWTAPFALDLTYKDKNSENDFYLRVPNGFKLDLLIAIDQIGKAGDRIRIINYRVKDDKNINRISDVVMDSWVLPVAADALGKSKKDFWIDFKRGYKYRIQVVNRSIDNMEKNKIYRIGLYSIHSDLKRNL